MPDSRFAVLGLMLFMAGHGRAAVPQQVAPPHQRPLEPAGDVVLRSDGSVAEGSLPVTVLRSPDTAGPGGGGRYLVVVNSGYGVQARAGANEGQQSLQVVDLAATPAPLVVQEVYFPSPQSANVGAVFARRPRNGAWPLYVSGGFENRVWKLTFTPGAAQPITPAHGLEDGPLKAEAIDLTGLAREPADATYNSGREPIYPAGMAISSDGRELYVANNLGDSLGVVRRPDAARPELRAIDLRPPATPRQFVYPYDVRVVATREGRDKVYVSCWNDAAVVVVDPRRGRVVRRIPVGAHPTAMVATADGSRLFVASANSDTVSVIDTATDRELVRVGVGLGDGAQTGGSTQALALSANERVLFAANALTHSVAVAALGEDVFPSSPGDRDDGDGEEGDEGEAENEARTRVVGYIPTARYPSALAMIGAELFVGNGKGEAIARPNAPTEAFPANSKLRGAYAPRLYRGSLRRLTVPDPAVLAAMTTRVLQANGLLGEKVDRLFAGPSPIAHVIYIIKENRTYDQVFGDLAASGDGTPADGDASLALFGAGEAARRTGGPPQDIAPNHRALALRFGLFDRFFVNSEASPDGHNWSTAAFSTDYVDKAFRWSYSGRGRTYDYEGFNRMPDVNGQELPPGLALPASADELAAFMRRFVPYLNGWRDIAEPDSLYLWDAAARAGLSYRTYGEFVGTISADDVTAFNTRKPKTYPDTSPTVAAVAAKQALEAHHHPGFRSFDMWTPDAMTATSYEAARQSAARIDPLVTSDHPDQRFRGHSRAGAWLEEFRGMATDYEAGRGDRLPALSIVHLPNDHTVGVTPGLPTPQFHMAENDYALGRMVEAVTRSAYWKNTAILVVEDDAQDGPDHVDAHRSPLLVISAYNRRGALIHEMHNTVSLVRTLELLLGMPPMNQLDAAAVPITVFQDTADLEPYEARLPDVALDNLVYGPPSNARERHWAAETAKLALTTPDAANPRVLNQAIWFSVRGDSRPMPEPQRVAAFDVMRATIDEERAEAARQPIWTARLALERLAWGR